MTARVWPEKISRAALRDELEAFFTARIEPRFDAVERRLDGVEQRLDGVETRLSVVETDVKALRRDVTDIRRHLRVDDEQKNLDTVRRSPSQRAAARA